MSRLFARAILGFAVCFAAAPGWAAETPSVAVRTGDLDLATSAGVEQLHRRMATALTAVCGAVEPGDFLGSVPIRACRAKALREAAPQLALMTARHPVTAACARKADPAS